LVRENYLSGLESALSFWEENLKVVNNQVDQWLNFQQEYVKTGREFYENLPKEVKELWGGSAKAVNDEIDRLVAFQKDYVDSVRKVSDKFTKETLSLAEKNVEKTFSLFDEYLGLFRV
jgi:hypothetical protein